MLIWLINNRQTIIEEKVVSVDVRYGIKCVLHLMKDSRLQLVFCSLPISVEGRGANFVKLVLR